MDLWEKSLLYLAIHCTYIARRECSRMNTWVRAQVQGSEFDPLHHSPLSVLVTRKSKDDLASERGGLSGLCGDDVGEGTGVEVGGGGEVSDVSEDDSGV